MFSPSCRSTVSILPTQERAVTACPSDEHYARCQRDGRQLAIDCLTPGEARHYRGCLKAYEPQQENTVGRDEYGNSDSEPQPACDFEPALREVVELFFDIDQFLALRWRSGNVGI